MNTHPFFPHLFQSTWRQCVGVLLLLIVGSMDRPPTVAYAQATPPLGLPDQVHQIKEEWWQPLPIHPAVAVEAMPVNASEVRRLDDWIRIVVQTFNEDDSEIAIVENEFTHQPRKLTDNNAADSFPQLNLGATEVTFASNRDGNFEIYRINVDGTNAVRLTSHPFTDTMPVWSPDGQQIAFVSTRTGNAELFRMNRDGTALTQITNDGADDIYPSWSSVGNRLAWVRRNGTQRTLWVANADGSNAHAITGALPWLAHPVWSPGGDRLAFDYDASGDGWNDLALINADGSGLTVLASLNLREELWMGSWYTNDPDFGKGERLLVTKLVYYFDPKGILVDITGETRQLFLCCQELEPSEIATSNRELLPAAQRSDLWAPTSSVQPLPAYARAIAAPIRWQGSDRGPSGLAYYHVQYRTENTDWQNWRELGIETTMLFTGVPGQRAYFRTRALDHSENWEAWPASDEGDASTTLYQWELTGQATDNRGVPAPQLPITIQPAPLIAATTTAHDGTYAAYLTLSGDYQIQGDAALGLNSDWTTNFFRQPADSTLLTTTLTLGQPCVGICMAAAATGADPHWQTNSSSLAFAMATATDHSLHLLWADHATRKLYYQKRMSSGSWLSPELITTGSEPQTVVAIAIDQQQTVHVVWSAYSTQSSTYYVQRPQAGAWTAPEIIGLAADPLVMKLDHQGALHLFYSCSSSICQGGIYYQERLATGAWQKPVKIEEWNEQHALTLHLPGDGTVQLAWLGTSNSSNMGANTGQAVWRKTRQANGVWAPTTSGFTGYDLQAGQLAFDHKNRLHLLWIEQSWSANGATFYVQEEAPGQWSAPQALIRQDYDYRYHLLLDRADNWHLLATPPYFQPATALHRSQMPTGVWSNPQPLHGETPSFRVLQSIISDQGQMHFIVEDGHNSYGYRTTQLAKSAATFTRQVAITVPTTLHQPTLTFLYDLEGMGVASQFAVAIQSASVEASTPATTVFSTTQSTSQQLAWVDLTPWVGQPITATFTIQQSAGEPYLHATIHNLTLGSWTTPVITAVSPDKVKAGTATRLTISGQNWTTPPAILAGETALVDLNLLDETQLEATLPADLAPGRYDLLISIGDQRSVRANAIAVGDQLYLPIIRR